MESDQDDQSLTGVVAVKVASRLISSDAEARTHVSQVQSGEYPS